MFGFVVMLLVWGFLICFGVLYCSLFVSCQFDVLGYIF